MKIQGMKPVDRGLLLAAVALALLGAVQSGPSAAPAPAFSSPLEAIASRPDLQVFSSLLARWVVAGDGHEHSYASMDPPCVGGPHAPRQVPSFQGSLAAVEHSYGEHKCGT